MEKHLFEELDRRFGAIGFSRHKCQRIEFYSRQIGTVRHTMSYKVRSRPNGIEIEGLWAGLRFDDVERIVAEHEASNPLITPEDIEARETLGLSIEGNSFFSLFKKYWKATDATEAVIAGGQCFSYTIGKAGPFFERYTDPYAAFELLCAKEKAEERYGSLIEVRAKRTITLGWLIGGRRLADEAYKTYAPLLQGGLRTEVDDFVRSLYADTSAN